MRSKRFQMSAVLLGLAVVLGGCSMFPHDDKPSTPPPEPVQSQSDEDTIKQVVDPAKTIVAVAALKDVSGGVGFEACNDQGEPPYRGRLEMGFRIPGVKAPTNYSKQI